MTKIINILSSSLALLLALMTSGICIAVFYRYILGDPIPWIEQSTLLLFAWMIFLGCGIEALNKKHFAIDVIRHYCSKQTNKYLSIITAICTVMLSIYIGASAYAYFKTLNLFNKQIPLLEIPKYWAAIPIGLAAILLFASAFYKPKTEDTTDFLPLKGDE